MNSLKKGRYELEEPVLDALKKPLSEEEEAEARRLAEIAERAERKLEELKNSHLGIKGNNESEKKEVAKFLSKKEREELALRRLLSQREEQEKKRREMEEAHEKFVTGKALQEREELEREAREKEARERERRQLQENKESKELDHEVKAIRDHYLGTTEKKRKIIRPSEKFARIFQFDWNGEDDTGRNDMNPLYNNRMSLNALFGRGYVAGIDQKVQRKDSNFLQALSEKRIAELRAMEESDLKLSEAEKRERARARDRAAEELQRRKDEQEKTNDDSSRAKMGAHWSEKPLSAMTERDWRIFREDFDIRIQGGRATLPLRSWDEASLPPQIMQAIESVGYEKPTPIQRQSIPIGLACKDIIGIAETGSGKTAAFLIPMLCYMLRLPAHYIKRCDLEGPLAIVMAPTRELVQQIEKECVKLSKFTPFRSLSIVGGQDIEEQTCKLRMGVEIVIATPGRLVDCLDNRYMALNQCNYVVLDEADRMVDMGFESSVIHVMDTMGGLLKSEDEDQLEAQVSLAKEGREVYRVTAMFSATMPLEVERIAKTYLRHPVIIKIGDEDSGKNKRIDQRVQFITEGQKKGRLVEEIGRLTESDKAIVFINNKKQCDFIGRYLEGQGRHVGVLHGGKSQDQREETLDYFRSGDYQILVASDVAARGLDIPDVTCVINFDFPNRIENYCHRIGRTGRAGKSGVAISFLTEADTEVMFDLKTYLEATDMPVPTQLARHPSAQAPLGARDDKGNLMGQKRDTVQYAK